MAFQSDYSMRRRCLSFVLTFLVIANCHAALASDWADEPYTTHSDNGIVLPDTVANLADTGTIAPSGLQLHFAQAITALEIEIFTKHSTRGGITERLDSLEKAVFASTELPELSNNYLRLHRLLQAVPLSLESVQTAATTGHAGQMGQSDGGGGGSNTTTQNAGGGQRQGLLKTIFCIPRDATITTSRVLHSPTFWALVGVAGALFCGYMLARSARGYYANPCAGVVNPNDHWVSAYTDRNGVFHVGHMQSNPNGTMTDNFSSTCNVNPYTGQLGYIPPLY